MFSAQRRRPPSLASLSANFFVVLQLHRSTFLYVPVPGQAGSAGAPRRLVLAPEATKPAHSLIRSFNAPSSCICYSRLRRAPDSTARKEHVGPNSNQSSGVTCTRADHFLLPLQIIKHPLAPLHSFPSQAGNNKTPRLQETGEETMSTDNIKIYIFIYISSLHRTQASKCASKGGNGKKAGGTRAAAGRRPSHHRPQAPPPRDDNWGAGGNVAFARPTTRAKRALCSPTTSAVKLPRAPILTSSRRWTRLA